MQVADWEPKIRETIEWYAIVSLWTVCLQSKVFLGDFDCRLVFLTI